MYPIIKNNFTSPSKSPKGIHKFFPSLYFYLHDIKIVYQNMLLAKKGKLSDQIFAGSSYKIVEALQNVGVSLSVDGLENFVSLGRPAVIVGNHMSTLETFVLPWMLVPHCPLSFVIKKSLAEYPIFKHVVLSQKPVVVGRQNARQDLKEVMEQGQERLGKGRSVAVFPQSTRSVELNAKNFNSIGVKLARRAKVPVVPLALKTDAWSNGKLLKDFGPIIPERKVHFSFGAPMEIQGNGKQEQAKIFDFISSKLKTWNG